MRIGITGPIGSGKSCVATSLARLGHPVYSADLEARRLANVSEPLRRDIIALLGEQAYAGGEYNRKWIASRVFADAGLLRALNGLIHPVVFADYSAWCQIHVSSRWLFFESALLPRLDWGAHLDAVVAVLAPEDLRAERVMLRDAVTREQALARMRAQGSQREFEDIAEFTIHNGGTPAELERGVLHLIRAMEGRYV